MPDPVKTPATVLTGSTGDAKTDMTPRSSIMAFATAVAGGTCYVFHTDAALTGFILSGALNGTFLGLCLFDIFYKPRLHA